MATGGVFKLIACDGKADRMIMATQLLYNRIGEIIMSRTRAGKADITPTLTDLEKTHVLFMNAHFKPFAALGYEYNVTKPQSGTAAFGSSVTFSIPQFGDFFHDMVVRARLPAVYANTGTTPAQNGANTAAVLFPYNTAATAISGGAAYNLVDAFGNLIVAGTTSGASTGFLASYRNLVRYCEFPGNRLFSKVKFDVNGNPLDEYNTDCVVALDKFTVLPHKRTGNDRLVGQQVPIQGVAGVQACTAFDADVASASVASAGWNQLPITWKGTTTAAGAMPLQVTAYNTPSGIDKFQPTQSNQTVGMMQYQGTSAQPLAGGEGDKFFAAASGALGAGSNSFIAGPGNTTTPAAFGSPQEIQLDAVVNNPAAVGVPQAVFANNAQYDFSQRTVSFVNGPQTPKPIQPPLEIWNKLKFWFCDDVRLSIPSVSIPFGQRFITIEITSLSNLVYEVPSIYVETIQYFNNTAATGTTVRTYTPLVSINGLSLDTSAALTTMELYINNIFVNPEIHDIFIKRIGFSLIRVYRYQRTTQSTGGANEVLLSALKWPVEFMYVGVQPTFNTKAVSAASGLVTGGNLNVWRDWHRMTRQLEVTSAVNTQSIAVVNIASTVASSIGEVNPTKYYIPVSTVDYVSLVSHGIPIYQSYSDLFFASYAPYHYGGTNLQTPEDTGALFINMALFPRSYQPSGHLNISRVRETYLNFSSTYASANTPVVLIVIAICINFLLISDGSAVLRYST
jgi:Large eukaryotic DNA virus major capsid protein